jgi:hypothetical protein
MTMAAVLIIAVLAASQSQPSIEEVHLWLTYYYLKPRPELTVPSLGVIDRELQKEEGRSLADEVGRGGMRTFYARVFEQNVAVVEEAAQKLPSMPTGQQAFIREALRRCGTPDCARVLGAQSADRVTPPRQDPGTLDDSWAAFFATGDAKYVQEVIEVLPWSEIRGDVARLLTGGAARWSLASNAYQHRRVLEICEQAAAPAIGPTKRLLDEIVAEAKSERAKNPPPEPK